MPNEEPFALAHERTRSAIVAVLGTPALDAHRVPHLRRLERVLRRLHRFGACRLRDGGGEPGALIVATKEPAGRTFAGLVGAALVYFEQEVTIDRPKVDHSHVHVR